MKYCSHCGAEIMDDAVLCTKCGCWVNGTTTTLVESNAKLNVCSLVGFILSLVAIIFFVNIFGSLALAGMIVSIVGLVQVNKNSSQKGKGLAIAGVTVGACMFVFGMIIWISIMAS